MAAFQPTDLKRIQWSIALLVVLTAVGVATVMASLKFREVAVKSLKQATAIQSEIKGKLARAYDEELELRDKIKRYNEMDQQGIIGEEHRLDWIEQIKKVEEKHKLLEIQYELSPQKPLDAKILPGAAAGNFETLWSPMRLEMPLLHELDLLNFLDDLNRRVTAYLRLRSCSIDRLPPQAAAKGPSATAQLKAICELDWITIREKR
jgi:hypothetical protein